MSDYKGEQLGITLSDLYQIGKERSTSILENPFQWHEEYIPIFAGIAAVGIFIYIRKRKGKGRKRAISRK